MTEQHATFYRAPHAPTTQGPMVPHDYLQLNGSSIISYHSDVLTNGNIIGWARGDAATFSQTGSWPYLVTLTDLGDTGVLTTFLNVCMHFNTMKGCDRRFCRNYHQSLGKVMSNLPQREPECLGDVSPFVRAVKGVTDLLEWSESQTMLMLKLDDKHLKLLWRSKPRRLSRSVKPSPTNGPGRRRCRPSSPAPPTRPAPRASAPSR